jgi:hypothetical protein
MLLAVAVMVLLLYLLKPAARRMAVPSMVIWRLVLRTRKPTPDRLRWWLSLLLALCIALSLTLALVRPQISAFGGGAKSSIIVVDDSTTMAAIASDGKTRFQHALGSARDLVQAGPADARFMIADTRRLVGSPRLESRDGALATLARLHVVPGGRPQFPNILRSDERDVRAVLITDGVAALATPPNVQTLSVYQIADNVGITAFEVRPLPRDAHRFQAYVQIFNASPGNKQVQLQLAGAGAVPIRRVLQLAGGATASEVLDVSAYATGPIRASVDSTYDALPLDDVAFSYRPPSKSIRVVMVSAGNVALERSLKVLPRVQLSVVSPGQYAPHGGVDVWVFDRFAPRTPPSSAVLLFRPPPVDWLPRAGGELRDTNVAAWSNAHPVTDSLSLRDVLADRALHIRDVARAQVLASDPGHRPLILASPSGPRWVEVAFALEDSNLSLQAGFPAFLSNALNWMTGEPLALQAGLGLIELPVARAKVLDLDGRPTLTRELSETTLVEAFQPTFYTAIAPDRRVRVAANVLDPALSAINATTLTGMATAKPAAHSAAALLPAAWLALLALATVLLALEWWTYNRRYTI